MGQLTISLLGPFSATFGGLPLGKFRSNKVQALFAFLIVERAGLHQREALMDLLWPGLPQKSAQANLRQTLYLLRKMIPEIEHQNVPSGVPFLVSDRQGVMVHPDGLIELDVTRFNALAAASELAAWKEASALYRGDFLSDFYLPDSAPFEDWAAARRQAYRRRFLETLTLLTDQFLQEKAWEEAEKLARRQLTADDLRESAHRQLMKALSGRGRRRAALSHYESLCRLLQQEMAIDPSEATQALAEAIRTGESMSGGPGSEDGIDLKSPSGTPKHVLPPQPTRFFGREPELRSLESIMIDPDNRLVTILGLGGIGKTRLAVALGLRLTEGGAGSAAAFADGIFFVNLAVVQTADEVVAEIALSLNLALVGGQKRSPSRQLLDILRVRQLLLILDNFEHLVETAPLLSDILSFAPDVRLLVTSRAPLLLAEERLFPLDGFPFPEPEEGLTLETVGDLPTVRLFVDRARRTRPAFTLAQEDVPLIADLWRLTEGMPLAIELAAGWMGTLPLPDIVAEIRGSMDIMETDLVNVPARHRSIRAVFKNTWEGLNPEDQNVLLSLSVFRGGFTLSSAEEVARADRRAMARLLRQALIQFDPSHGRYDLHELLHQFLKDIWVEKPAIEQQIRDDHSRHYLTVMASLEQDIKGSDPRPVLEILRQEFENLRAAWRWAATQDYLLLIRQSVEIFMLVCSRLNRMLAREKECRFAYEALLARESNDPPRSPEAVLTLLVVKTWLANTTYDHAEGSRLIEECLAFVEESPLSAGLTVREKANIYFVAGDLAVNLAQARQNFERVRSIAGDGKDPRGYAIGTYFLSAVLTVQGEIEQAVRFRKESLAKFEHLGELFHIIQTRKGLARLLCHGGEFEEAETMLRQGLAASRRSGIQILVNMTEHQLVKCLFLQGKFEAITLYVDRLKSAWMKAYEWNGLTEITLISGLANLHLARNDQALAEVRKSLDSLEFDFSSGSFMAGYAYYGLGCAQLAQSNLQDGRAWLAKALSFSQEQDKLRYVMALATLSRVLHALGDRRASLERIIEAVEMVLKVKSVPVLLEVLPAAAYLMAQAASERSEGEQGAGLERALELYAMANRYGYIQSSYWFAGLYEQPIRTLAAVLPTDRVAAAEDRGRQLDMWATAASLKEELIIAAGHWL